MNVYKSKGKRIFEIVHWPFELPPNLHRRTSLFGWHKWCSLAQPSKGQCTISKILSSLIFSLFIERNIFFLETCFAYTISEPKFTMCTRHVIHYHEIHDSSLAWGWCQRYCLFGRWCNERKLEPKTSTMTLTPWFSLLCTLLTFTLIFWLQKEEGLGNT